MAAKAIIVGAGHNGLICGAYLARAGVETLILERRPVVGGACITEEIHPGFHVSTTSYVCGLIRPEIIADLQLKEFGFVQRAYDPQYFVPFRDRKTLYMWVDEHKTIKELEKFSKHDAKTYAEFEKFWLEFFDIVEPAILVPPPPLADLAGLFQGTEAEEILKKVIFASVKDFLEEYFESEYVKAVFAPLGTGGTFAGPSSPGTAYVLGHHLLGNVDGVKGLWSYAVGGMGAIAEAMRRCAEAAGAKVKTGTDVKRIIVESGVARGVELADGTKLHADLVVSNADPKATFLKLVEPDHLEPSFRKKIGLLHTDACSFKVNLALDGVPEYTAAPGKGLQPLHRAAMDICPFMDELEREFHRAKNGEMTDVPFMDCFMQSANDPSVAPKGKHTFSIVSSYFPFKLAKGDWPSRSKEAEERIIGAYAEHAPNIRKLILASRCYSPWDFQEIFGITGGNPFHLNVTPDQMFSLRPLPGWSTYATPIKGLYLCGAGTHPGGGIIGACGHNAAKRILEDLQKAA